MTIAPSKFAWHLLVAYAFANFISAAMHMAG